MNRPSVSKEGAAANASSSSQHHQTIAFTLPELLVVVCTVGILMVLHVFAQPRVKGAGETAVCMENLRRLSVAWTMYARDNRDRFPGNLDGGGMQTNLSWCVGWLDNTSFRPDNTNVDLLMTAQLGRYSQTPSIYHCPADHSKSAGLTGDLRVRSVTMNGYLGERSGPYTAGYRLFRNMSELTDPAPAGTFVFMDEREDSINDSWFGFDMSGSFPTTPIRYVLVDYPADWHDRGANLSFADGHVENWRWQDRRTTPEHRPGTLIPLAVASPNNVDVGRLQAVTSRRVALP